MNLELRQSIMSQRRRQHDSLKRGRIRREREAMVNGTEAMATDLEFGEIAEVPLAITFAVNEHWIESEHRVGIPLLLAMRGIAIDAELDRTVEPPVLRITRHDPEALPGLND